MKASELMIGNNVKWGLGTLQLGIDDMNKQAFDYAEPIPLTNDVLVDNLGFNRCERIGSTIIDYVIFGEDDFDSFTVFCIDIKKGLGFAGCKYKIKYVHQLQILYFALKGEKLIFKQSKTNKL